MVGQEIMNVLVNLIVLATAIFAVVLFVWPRNPDRIRWIAGILAVMAFSWIVAQFYWEDLRDGTRPLDEAIRNVSLSIATLIGIMIAIWRSSVAERQVETAQRSLQNERYQQGAEMLGSGILTVRLGGIYALQSLAEEHSKEYHVQAMKLLSAFLRTSARREVTGTEAAESSGTDVPREDIQDAMTAIGRRNESRVQLEVTSRFELDLSSVDLRGLRLEEANLSGAILVGSDLGGAWLSGTDLTDTVLGEANLSGARLGGADVSGSKWWATNLSAAILYQTKDGQKGVDWGPVKGLTQEHLYFAVGDIEPTGLDAVVGPEGEVLKWPRYEEA